MADLSSLDFSFPAQMLRQGVQEGAFPGAVLLVGDRTGELFRCVEAVSYTHLDVYKRQVFPRIRSQSWAKPVRLLHKKARIKATSTVHSHLLIFLVISKPSSLSVS